jgi:hypothetical protein
MSTKSTLLEKEIALSIEFVKMMTEVPNALPYDGEYEENPEATKDETKSKRLSREAFNAKIRAEAEEAWREANTVEARLGKTEADVWRKFVASMPKEVRRANNAKVERLYRRQARLALWTRAERRFFSHLQYCTKHGFEAKPVAKTPADVAHYPQSTYYLFS